MGPTGYIRAMHEINTLEQKHVRQLTGPIPVYYQAQLEEIIQRMMDAKVIKLSASSGVSPIVLMEKKNGSLLL